MAMKECQKCGGSGFLTENRDGGVYARPCSCRKLNQKEMLVRGAGIPQRYREKCVFSEFKPNHESQRDALTIAKRYAEEYPALPGDRNGLLFLGPCGTGKTHLAVAILQDILFHSGLPGLFVDLNDLYREIRSSYDPGSEGTEYAILAPLVEAPLLLIDELGCVASPWAQDTLHYLVSRRYNEQLPTLLTSNYMDDAGRGEEALGDRIGTRTRSRLAEMTRTVVIDGTDYRRQ
jgi:DNA replication protein DnaC